MGSSAEGIPAFFAKTGELLCLSAATHNCLGRGRIEEDIVRSPAICPLGRHIGAADLTLQVGSVKAVQAATTLQAAVVGSQLHVLRVGDVCDEAPNIGVKVKGLFR